MSCLKIYFIIGAIIILSQNSWGCKVVRDWGASRAQLIQASAHVGIIRVLSGTEILDSKREGVGIWKIEVIKALKGDLKSINKIVTMVGPGQDDNSSMSHSWFQCGLAVRLKTESYYLVDFDFMVGNSILPIKNENEGVEIFKKEQTSSLKIKTVNLIKNNFNLASLKNTVAAGKNICGKAGKDKKCQKILEDILISPFFELTVSLDANSTKSVSKLFALSRVKALLYQNPNFDLRRRELIFKVASNMNNADPLDKKEAEELRLTINY